MSYADILEESLSDKKAFPDSIPHFLHWDLMYLAILECEGPIRPRGWRGRVDGWKFLLRCLLTGHLKIEHQVLTSPVATFAGKFGVQAVDWVFLAGRLDPVGVLSPTVIVRPLPDFSDADLIQWSSDSKDHLAEDDTFRVFLGLALARLEDHKRNNPDSFAVSRLVDVLRREFSFSTPSMPSNPGREQRIHVLDRVSFVHAGEIDATQLRSVPILVAMQGPHVQKFVPRCEICGEWLTRDLQHEPIDASAGVVKLLCAERHETVIPLANFGVWTRDQSNAVVWRTDSGRFVATPPPRGFPPLPRIEGSVLVFEWGPAQVGGDPDRRFLKISLPGHRLELVDPASIFFERLVAPGFSIDRDPLFKPLPVRLEWLDALQDPDQTIVDVATEGVPYLKFRNLRLKGYFLDKDDASALAFSKEFRGPLLEPRPEVGIGIFPNPSVVSSRWRWYRVFVDGARAGEFKILGTPSLRELTHDLSEGDEIKAFSVVSREQPDSGITFLGQAPLARSTGGNGTINLGLDFGTTSTLVYHSTPQLKYSGIEAEASRHRFRPGAAVNLCHWIRQGGSNEKRLALGGFLPGGQYGSQRDPFLVPSAILTNHKATFIRWSGAQLSMGSWGFVPIGDFKWDKTVRGENWAAREAYLTELLFIVLPTVLSDYGQKTASVVNVGYAFPLAFGEEAVADLNALHVNLTSTFKQRTGLELQFNLISESHAAVRAFGRPNPSETFLIADMGGGTMDLAVVRGHESAGVLQVGSILFAGNQFLRAFLLKRGGGLGSDLEWELRDLIVEGATGTKYGGEATTGRKLTSHVTMAFEFLRAMIEAQRIEDGARTRVTVVLVGNGWHLVEEFGARTSEIGKGDLFKIFVGDLIKKLGIEDIDYKTAREIHNELPSSKHLVAIGALQSAETPTFAFDERPSRLPAGRGMRLEWPGGQHQTINWSDTIGMGGEVQFLADPVRADTHFLFNDMPPVSDSWNSHFRDVFGASDPPYPEQAAFRDDFYIRLNPPVTRPLKGPLQLLLEGYWADWLCR